MMDYIKKRAQAIELSPLRYAGAFGDGYTNTHECSYYSKDTTCPKLFKAYRDGKRMRKKVQKNS